MPRVSAEAESVSAMRMTRSAIGTVSLFLRVLKFKFKIYHVFLFSFS